MIMNKRIVLLVVLLLLGQCMWAQSTRVKGKVTDAKTGEVLPLVNVFFTGTTIGMTTDFDGEYYLETREEVTELQASFVGYLPKTVKINKGAYNAVDFQLEPQTFDLDEVKVTPGENPAHVILRNVSKNKYRNNPARFEQYYCKTYTKMELDTQPPEHRSLLCQITYPQLCTLINRFFGYFLIIQKDPTTIRSDQSDNHIKRSRFPSTIRPQQTHNLSLLHLHRYIFDNGTTFIFFYQMFCF